MAGAEARAKLLDILEDLDDTQDVFPPAPLAR
jgi:transcriptional/translational regulatory protein YebC/TACO1